MKNITLTPVGQVRSTRKLPEDDDWDREESAIELDSARFSAEALAGLAEFSHVEVVYFMDQVDPAQKEWKSRHPRGNPKWPKVGIFSQRGKDRPNPIGVSVCEIRKIEGTLIQVTGLDAIEGTPVLDVKPWVAEFGPRGNVRQPDWVSELMRGYWKKP